jgi:hypothetical protein
VCLRVCQLDQIVRVYRIVCRPDLSRCSLLTCDFQVSRLRKMLNTARPSSDYENYEKMFPTCHRWRCCPSNAERCENTGSGDVGPSVGNWCVILAVTRSPIRADKSNAELGAIIGDSPALGGWRLNDRKGCHPDTRRCFLDHIIKWVENLESECASFSSARQAQESPQLYTRLHFTSTRRASVPMLPFGGRNNSKMRLIISSYHPGSS